MPTCRGVSYLLGESSECHFTQMESQLEKIITTLANLQDQFNDMNQTFNQSQERLIKLETDREPSTTKETPL